MFHLNLTKKKSLDLLTEEVWKENIGRLFANLINQISTSQILLIPSIYRFSAGGALLFNICPLPQTVFMEKMLAF